MTPQQRQALALRALADLLEGKYTSMTHHAGEAPTGRPLPVKRMAPDAAGNVTQDYRPIAVLEWLGDMRAKPALAPLPPLRPMARCTLPVLPPLPKL